MALIIIVFIILTLPLSPSSFSPSNSSNDELSSMAFDYSDALSKAILFLEGQRSGKLPPNQRAKWRGDSALNDGKPDNVKLTGGYYDAGDNVKFGWPMAFTVTLLSWAAIEYQKPISSAKQMGHLREAIRWGSDFIAASHTTATTLYTQIGDAKPDHECWERPEDMDTPRTLYKITSSAPGTEAAAEASAALAATSMVFKGVDDEYSTFLLGKAKSLFVLADKYRGTYSKSCPFYCSNSGFKDELIWAAAWLYRATGEDEHLTYLTSNQGFSGPMNEFSWDNKNAGSQTLLSKEFYGGKKDLSKYKTDAESFMCSILPGSSASKIKMTPGGLLYTRDAANFQYAMGSTMLLLIYAKTFSAAKIASLKCGSTNFSPAQIKTFTKTQVDYILGKNPMKMSYMVGYGTEYPRQLHHRGASIPSIKTSPAKVGCNQGYNTWFPAKNDNPNVHVGALVAGPKENDEFSDLRSDHAHLEPMTYLNAAFIGTVAGLLSKGLEEVELESAVINMAVDII